MKKILFDLTTTQPDGNIKRHGGGKYGEIVLKQIISRKLPIYCCYDSSLWFNPEIKEIISKNGITLFDLSQHSLSDIVLKENISLVYIPTNVNKIDLASIKCPVLGTIHGVRGLENPIDYYEMFYRPYKNILRYLKKRIFTKQYLAKREKFVRTALNSPNFSFVTVSNHSANAFISYFPNYKKKIKVFYSPSTICYESSEIKYEEQYFLLVSGNRALKNNLRAIKALDRLFTYGFAKGFRVKVTGVTSADSYLYRIKNIERFDFVGFVDEKELDQLYHDAYCFIYPTLNEGFGYPPLEAMHYSVPVLTSPFSAIPEICGGNVIYFNPFSVEEIMNRILMILDKDIHDKYSTLSKERYVLITNRQNEDLDRLIDYIYNV